MSDNEVLFALKTDTCYLKLKGMLRYSAAQNLDGFVRDIFRKNKTVHFVVDLTETSYMDSTILGIVGMIGATVKNKSTKPMLVCPGKDIHPILCAMGFESLFEISQDADNSEQDYQEIPQSTGHTRPVDDLVLTSHQTLAEMNTANKEKFTPVIEAIIKRKKHKK